MKDRDAESSAVLSEGLKTQLANYVAVSDIEDSLSDGKEKLQLEPMPEARLLGVDLNQVAWKVRQAVFGILFATFITLFVVPLNYLILENIKGYFSRYFRYMKSLRPSKSKYGQTTGNILVCSL